MILGFVASARATPTPARYLIRASCIDGRADSVVARGQRTSLAIPRCDDDGQRDGVCTFRTYFGCEPPLLCPGTAQVISVRRGSFRRPELAPFPQRYRLRCRRGR